MDPLLSVDPLAGLFKPPRVDSAQPVVFATATVADIDFTGKVQVTLDGTTVTVSMLSSVAYADLAVGATVALLGVRVGPLTTYMVCGVIDVAPLVPRDAGGLRLIGIERYDNTFDGATWSPDNYPGLRAIYAEAQAAGGGGGGGGAAAAGQHSVGAGGGAGGYANGLFWRGDLASSITMTIPATTPGSSAAAVAGTTGDPVAFGLLLGANGGTGGGSAASNVNSFGVDGGAGGAGTVGTYLQTGQGGHWAWGDAGLCGGGSGGSSRFGAGGRGRNVVSAGQSQSGQGGVGYGSGGAGATVAGTGAAASGGAGPGGLIVIHLYG